MAKKSLNKSIFRLVVGIVLLASTVIVVNVWWATINQAQDRLNRDLGVAQNVLEQVLFNRESVLFISASVLTADFGFKQAVATADEGTIESALLNHGERINADVMALVSLSGENITSTPALLKVGADFHYPKLLDAAISEGGASALILLKDELYQVIMLSVDAPAPLAVALIGFKLNTDLVTQLKDITQLETTIQTIEDNTAKYSISTLSSELSQKVMTQIDAQLTWFAITIAKDIPYTSRRFLLANEYGLETFITLSEDVQKLFIDFNDLQLRISLISALAVFIAMLFAALFSKRLADPLVSLADIAKRISRGDYTKSVSVRANTEEVNHLSNAFQVMQNSIKTREQEIIFKAQHDILTSLYNRYYIETLLDEKFNSDEPFLAIGINIFGFRGINDVFGYHNGDRCLTELANRVSKLGGLSARLTGGELLWVPDVELSLEQIHQHKLLLEKPVDTGEVIINLKVALGLLRCPEDANCAEELFRRLNIVLDEAQITRQFTLRFGQQLENRYLRRLSIITELKHTLSHAQHELALFYQPKLNLADCKVTSAEALIRWNNAKLGFVSPEDFIAFAEHAGFIESITLWVIEQAIKDAVVFKQNNINACIAINLSARDVMNPNLLSYVREHLSENGLNESHLSFEITEGDLVRDPAKAIEQLNAFQKQGFKVAIDDFGTGYSSMAYLQNLPINTLKIDKGFVLKLDSQQGDQNIVKTVINLAHSFNLSVVAEGVETLESLTLLKSWGCEFAQGYYICKPVAADQFVEWHKKNEQTNWLEKQG